MFPLGWKDEGMVVCYGSSVGAGADFFFLLESCANCHIPHCERKDTLFFLYSIAFSLEIKIVS